MRSLTAVRWLGDLPFSARHVDQHGVIQHGFGQQAIEFGTLCFQGFQAQGIRYGYADELGFPVVVGRFGYAALPTWFCRLLSCFGLFQDANDLFFRESLPRVASAEADSTSFSDYSRGPGQA